MVTFKSISWILFSLLSVVACRENAATTNRNAPATTPPETTAAPGSTTNMTIPTVLPAYLAGVVAQSGTKPLLFHVGFKKLYEQAHIPGSEYFGPGSENDALARLEQRVASLPKMEPMILYCGCCPWERCPNVKPAYKALHDLGFTDVRVLFITKDFGTDWADKNYPVASGE